MFKFHDVTVKLTIKQTLMPQKIDFTTIFDSVSTNGLTTAKSLTFVGMKFYSFLKQQQRISQKLVSHDKL